MLKPLADADWPDSLADMKNGFATQLNVYRSMAHYPALLAAWKNFRNHVVLNSCLTPPQSEIVIIRTGVRLGSEYEWKHHVCRGRKVGLSDQQILSLRGPLDFMFDMDKILCAAVDELFDTKCLSPFLQEALTKLVGQDGVMDVIATVSHYTFLGYFLNTFSVPLDENISKELTEHPIE
jgi:alkylhydroperoxidase family enzyme